MPTNTKPTIVVFSCFYEPYMSGAERFVKEVVERLADQFRFVVITSRIDRKNLKRETMGVEGCTYEVRRIGFGARLDKWLYPVMAPFVAMRYHPRIVHAVMESYAGVALWLYSFIDGYARTILTLQSGDLDSPEKQGKIPSWLWRKIHTTPDRITAISTFLKKRALRLGADPDGVSIIPNGVDLKHITFTPKPVPRRIVSVARLSWEKGLEYLIDALPHIQKEYNDAHVVIVGGGPLEDDLKKRAEKAGVSDSVQFLGNQPHHRVLEEIAKGEVFITPSLAEGLGIVFIEAQAVGVPVIGTNVGGIPDVIKDGETGMLIPARSVSAIAGAVTKLFNDHELKKTLTMHAKQRLDRFDWRIISKQVADLYQSLKVY